MSTLHRFYTAFAQRDWKSMGACYRDDARFSDPVFPDLDAAATCAMWKMLMSGAKDFRLTFSVIEETGNSGRVQWDAHYTFSKTGRPVHNRVTSTFTLKDGLILKQVDRFDFWRWSRQALGITGWLLGWTPMLKAKVRATAAAALEKSRSGITPP